MRTEEEIRAKYEKIEAARCEAELADDDTRALLLFTAATYLKWALGEEEA